MFRRAFTLIELLVVISIVALLSGVVLASLNSAREKGRIGGSLHFATQVDHIAGDQAVALWDFDECASAGTSVTDRSGFNNNGTLTAVTTWPTDTPSGKGCSLVTSPTQGVTVPNSQSLDFGLGDFTISLWVKNSQPISAISDIYGLVGKTDGATSGYVLALRGGFHNGILFRYRGTYDLYLSTPQGDILSNGMWHHITLVKTGSTGEIYLDGVKLPTNSVTFSGTASNNLPLYIGRWSSTSFYLSGSIDNVHLFSKSLTAAEVHGLYAAETEKFISSRD